MDDKTRQAIDHLYEALLLLACVRDQGDMTSIPIHIGPATGGRTVHVTAKTAEAITDAVDSINAQLSSDRRDHSAIDELLQQTAEAVTDATPIDPESMARRKDHFMGWLESRSGEVIESGEWSAAAVAQCYPDLYADVTDLFAALDPIEITDKVIRDRQADLPDVAQLLDELFGDIPYPYADEDVPLPHDQTQMDALTAEVENYLRDGGE
jgi:hypothetical protein